MLAEPLATPVTMPDDDPTVAMAVLLLLQRPLAVPSVNVVGDPEHTDEAPEMAPGVVFTMTTAVS